MAVFDKLRVFNVSDQELDELSCGICHEIFVNPVVLRCCRQTYCRTCIEEWLNHHNTCPNDRQLLSLEDLLPPPRALINIVDNLRVYCPYRQYGCEEELTKSEFERHVKDCPFITCETCETRNEFETEHNCLQVLKSRIDGLTQENQGLSEEKFKLSEEIKGLEEVNHRLSEDKNKISEEKQRMSEEINGLTEENHRLSEDKKKISEENQLMSEEIIGLKEVNQRLREDKSKISEKTRRMSEKINGFKEEIKGLKEENKKLCEKNSLFLVLLFWLIVILLKTYFHFFNTQ